MSNYIFEQFSFLNQTEEDNSNCNLNFIDKNNGATLSIVGSIGLNKISGVVGQNYLGSDVSGEFTVDTSTNSVSSACDQVINYFSIFTRTINLYGSSGQELNVKLYTIDPSNNDPSNNLFADTVLYTRQELHPNFVNNVDCSCNSDISGLVPLMYNDYDKLQLSYENLPYHVYNFDTCSDLSGLIQSTPTDPATFFFDYFGTNNLQLCEKGISICFPIFFYDYTTIYIVEYLGRQTNVDGQEISSLLNDLSGNYNTLPSDSPFFRQASSFSNYYFTYIGNLNLTIETLVTEFSFKNSDAITYVSFVGFYKEPVQNTTGKNYIINLMTKYPYNKTNGIIPSSINAGTYYKNQYQFINGYYHMVNFSVIKIPPYVTNWVELQIMNNIIYLSDPSGSVLDCSGLSPTQSSNPQHIKYPVKANYTPNNPGASPINPSFSQDYNNAPHVNYASTDITTPSTDSVLFPTEKAQ